MYEDFSIKPLLINPRKIYFNWISFLMANTGLIITNQLYNQLVSFFSLVLNQQNNNVRKSPMHTCYLRSTAVSGASVLNFELTKQHKKYQQGKKNIRRAAQYCSCLENIAIISVMWIVIRVN